MLNKPLSKIEEADLQNLVDNREKESVILEYKQAISGVDKEKKEISKDISALANTEGGCLIIGIEEEEGRASNLTGTPKLIGRQPVEEWVESVLISNVRPKLGIRIKTISMTSDDTKCFVVIQVPVSSQRPHMVVSEGKHAYYKRHNYQTAYADEHEVRSMFLESKGSQDEMKEFLKIKNLDSIANPNFAKTPLSLTMFDTIRRLRELPDTFVGNPIILFASCPKFLEERIDIASDDFRAWLDSHNQIDLFDLNIDFLDNNKEITSNSIRSVRKINAQEERDRLPTRYVEINRNGYVETGTGSEMIWTHRDIGVMLQIAYFTASFWLFLKFIQKLYEKIGYVDEVSILISLADIHGVTLHGFGRKNANTNYLQPYDFLYHSESLPTATEQNVLIERLVLASELNDEYIENLVKEVSTRVANAFGAKIPKCFDDAGVYDRNQLRGFRNIH